MRRVTEIASAALEMAASSRKVADAMHSMGGVVEENTAATEQMAAQAAEVNSAIAAIACVSEEQSASTQEASASTEEMSAQMQEMSAQARGLAATAQQLKTLVDLFSIDQSAPLHNIVPSAAQPSGPGAVEFARNDTMEYSAKQRIKGDHADADNRYFDEQRKP